MVYTFVHPRYKKKQLYPSQSSIVAVRVLDVCPAYLKRNKPHLPLLVVFFHYFFPSLAVVDVGVPLMQLLKYEPHTLKRPVKADVKIPSYLN